MKFIKSLFLCITLILLCATGVLADETVQTPTAYLNESGEVTPLTGINLKTIDSTEEASPPITLSSDSGSTSWYWAGGNTVGKAVEINKPVTISGNVNLVVGPNGVGMQSAAMIFKQGLTIQNGANVNLYQAAAADSSGNNTVDPTSCFLAVSNSTLTTSENTPQAAAVINGTLNVISAAFEPQGSNNVIPLLINGIVNTETYGSIEADASPQNDTNTSVPATGMALGTSGKLNANGGVTACFNGLTVAEDNQVATAIIANAATPTTANASGVTVNGGSVWAGNTYENASSQGSLTNGLWMENTTSGSSHFYAFGTSTLHLNVFSFVTTGTDGVLQPSVIQNGDGFTALSGSNFTFPNNPSKMCTMIFGDKGTLEIQQNGSITIPTQTTIDMQQGSVLTNNGTINVDSPE